MKILALCPYVPFPPTHGGRIRSGVVVGALAAEHDVELACPIGAEEQAAAEECQRGLGLRRMHTLPVSDAAPVAPFRKISRWMRGRSDVLWRRWSRPARRQVRDLVANDAFDLLLIDGTFAWPIAPRGFRGSRLLSLHNLEAEVLSRLARGLPGRVEAGMLERIEARAANLCERTVVVSERERVALAALAPRATIEVVPNTVDLSRIALLPSAEPAPGPRLLFVGGFDYPPNREAAERILRQDLPLLRSVWPDLRFRFVGNDPGGEIAKRAKHVDGAEAVGFVPDLEAEYRAATAVYVPLSSGGGTRIKILEAMARGRPVIATALAVEGLGLRKGVHYLDCGSSEQGVASLRAVVDGGGGAALVQAARALVECEFDHSVATTAITRIARELAPK